MLLRAPPITLPEYKTLLARLWPDKIKQLGLAVSGGIDSMALAHLTHKLATSPDYHGLKVHAFVIDHCARPTSTTEALAVASILKSYGFIANVLPLQWDPTAGGFETRARSARYKVLANACVEHGVDRLLLGHHADDQAETVIMRLATGSRFDGLAGMKAVAGIPESGDVFGARKIVVGRPFLDVGKERLQVTCEHNSVPWFEDATNHDATFTRRNAVRQLLTSTPPRLPRALQRDSLVALSKRAEARNQNVKTHALALLRSCELNLDPRTGTLHLALPYNRAELWKDVLDPVLIRVLIEAAEMVSPNERVETRQMTAAAERVFSAGDDDEISVFTTAGLTWTYCGRQKWMLDREPLYPQKRNEAMEFLGDTPGWSEWRLWDGRWWIRVKTRKGMKSTCVRVLREADMKTLRKQATEMKMKKELEQALKDLKMTRRFTVPAVFWKRNKDKGEEEILVGLPSVGLDFVDPKLYGANYEVKFKG